MGWPILYSAYCCSQVDSGSKTFMQNIKAYRIPGQQGYAKEMNDFVDFIQEAVSVQRKTKTCMFVIVKRPLSSKCMQFQCCGILGPQDWVRLNPGYIAESRGLPLSCSCSGGPPSCLRFDDDGAISFSAWTKVSP